MVSSRKKTYESEKITFFKKRRGEEGGEEGRERKGFCVNCSNCISMVAATSDTFSLARTIFADITENKVLNYCKL